MTTIAVSQSEIAADTQRVAGYERIDLTTKKIIVEQKTVFAFTGDYGIFPAARDWYLAGHKPDEAPKVIKDGSWRLLVISAQAGCLWSYSDSTPYGEPFSYPQAFGSGGPYALAALKLGKSPREAIELAMELDVYTGGDIQVVDIAEALGVAPPSTLAGRRQVSRIDPVSGKRRIRIEETAA